MSSLAEVLSPVDLATYPAIQPIVQSLEGEATKSLADIVGEQILSRIVRGELAEGTRLKSTLLAEELRVSRTPVAKALAKLSGDGILLQPNNHQAVVAPGAANWLIQTHELRQTLEPEAAARAAGRIPPEVAAELLRLADVSRPSAEGDWQPYARLFDFALHLVIANYCGNVPMKTSIRKCWIFKRLSYELSEGCTDSLPKEQAEHAEILAALLKPDAELARKLMAAHLSVSSERRYSDRVV